MSKITRGPRHHGRTKLECPLCKLAFGMATNTIAAARLKDVVYHLWRSHNLPHQRAWHLLKKTLNAQGLTPPPNRWPAYLNTNE